MNGDDGDRSPTARHLLVTNDFPPKVGGIQSYLWELWRRLPPDDVTVLTTPYAGDRSWDRAQPFRVVRSRRRVLLPTPGLVREIDQLAAEVDAPLVLLDPVWPLGVLGPRLERPYGVVLHGAEVTVPGRMPGTGALIGWVLRGSKLVVAAGGYPAAEGRRAAGRDLPTVVVPPGVDTTRFVPLDDPTRRQARQRWLVGEDRQDPDGVDLVVSVSRLVPRKGMDVLIEAAARLAPTRPRLRVLIGGDGRDRRRLERIARDRAAPVRFLGRVAEDDLPDLYGAADVFAMVCRNRWLGLEQEGFGIVFLEAAAAGVPQVAGRSGGSHEAVVDGVTGAVVDRPGWATAVADALARLLDDGDRRARMGRAARDRVVAELTYDHLAARLADGIAGV